MSPANPEQDPQPDVSRIPDGPGGAAGPASAVDVLDRLGQLLAMAGLRLAGVRRRLDSAEDTMMLTRASDDLDEAIAEVRRLALALCCGGQRGQPMPPGSPDGRRMQPGEPGSPGAPALDR
jgi:hypothetical protein